MSYPCCIVTQLFHKLLGQACRPCIVATATIGNMHDYSNKSEALNAGHMSSINNHHHDGDFGSSQACETDQTLFARDAYTASDNAPARK